MSVLKCDICDKIVRLEPIKTLRIGFVYVKLCEKCYNDIEDKKISEFV